MAHRSQVLRRRITELLTSSACQNIDFRWAAERIMGAQYTMLAISLNGSSQRRIQEEVGHVESGLAQYIIERNTIRAPWESFGAGEGQYAAYERMSLVHECTHAIFDMVRRHPTINALSNEMVAYVAGALFNLNSGRPYANDSDHIWKAANDVAVYVSRRGGGIIGPENAVSALREAILADRTYRHLKRNPHLTWRNDGVAL